MATAVELRNWTQPGAQDAAQATYASVKTALARSAAVQAYQPEVFLQGSYANHTNTRGDSDVDIVVMMKSAYMPDIGRLTVPEIVRYNAVSSPATTSVEGLRQAVTDALNSYYGYERVHPRNKCIRVDKQSGYVDADVVPAQQHRLYESFPAYGEPRFIEGISIQPLSGRRIVNYPKEHIKNGEAKNRKCSNFYKPTVRQIKRLRRAAVDAGLVGKKDAPGYLLECLTYNAPTSYFTSDDTQRVIKVLSWLQSFSASELAATIKSCDDIHWLFKTDPGDHNEYLAHKTIKTLWDFL
ncbi:nucleotidyltransferase [Blastococcus sp. CT_GayMR19]|uniref:nucleotidyltransferase domain-containing protein n=1 Tax=Blastococcus sp. CT_GayMR19 TaxID=2559608 RepID=UPI0010733F17|nr:nucleotidyltransferase [Blastococcus sp. CT_GayMR19]TFV78289.1 nucleotidyltransferase [Blastococcus sp. CT_GayMR19]